MSRNSITVFAVVAALSLSCLAPGAAAAGVAFSHVTAFTTNRAVQPQIRDRARRDALLAKLLRMKRDL
jgi:hypothetical protein